MGKNMQGERLELAEISNYAWSHGLYSVGRILDSAAGTEDKDVLQMAIVACENVVSQTVGVRIWLEDLLEDASESHDK